jgi:hypothetical protein
VDPPVGIFLVIMVMAGFIGYAIWDAAQRRKSLSTWAASSGLDFSAAKDHGLDDRYPGFSCLRRGHSRYAHNIMRGELVGLKVTAFDYHYVTGHGKHRRTHRMSALIAQSDVPLQHLFIRRENAFDKVTEFFGADDIDFESAEFSKKFYVKAKDKRWAYAVIHQGMMEYLLQAPSFGIEFDLTEIIVWRSRRLRPEDFAAAAQLIRGIRERLPDYLVQEMRGERITASTGDFDGQTGLDSTTGSGTARDMNGASDSSERIRSQQRRDT